MFGDFGHGILMTLFAAYLIAKEKELGAGPMNEVSQHHSN
jgi:vacuolar-type H+-ATPase subunit I/STV1